MKNTRNIVVKALFNVDEFTAFDEVCKEDDVSHSKALRDMANKRVAHRKREKQESEWPGFAQRMAMFFPGRPNYGASQRMNMRR